MSDEWKFFMCTMGKNLASIMVDIGISEGIQHTPPNLATISLTYKQPDHRGLPTHAEFDAVVAIGNQIEAFVKLGGDAYVGRIKKEGQRIYFIYTQRAEARWQSFVQQLAERAGYLLELEVEADDEHYNYWEYLYPKPDDWQVITDMEVIASLKKAGDDSDAEHKFDHFIYFPDERSAKIFVAWATGDRFTHDAESSGWTPDRAKYRVNLSHRGTTNQRPLSLFTCALRRKAEEFGGKYDGWETAVIKKSE